MKKQFTSAAKTIGKFVDLTLVLSSVIALIAFTIGARALAAPMLNGAGSTFAEPILTKWFAEYGKKDSTTQVNYQGGGSGAGIRQLIAGTVDFGATDSVMTPEELKKARTTVAHIPVVMGGVVVSYNLKLAQPLKLTGAVVAQIFEGGITKWNDPKITALNPGLAIPDMPIIVATRSDGSGTTAVFSEFLEKSSPAWKGKTGKSVNWFKGSMGAKGNAGVSGLIMQAEGTVGYIESVYALQNNLPYALIANAKGKFVGPTLESVSASIPAKLVAQIAKEDFKTSIVNSEAADAYPISAMTWLLIYEQMPKEKGEALMKSVRWILSDEAQKHVKDLKYAPLPKELRTKILARLDQVKLN